MDLNTRSIVVAGGEIKLSLSAVKRGETICGFCPERPACHLPEVQERCGQFVPALTFAPPHVGLDGRFSTFRPSELWHLRAQVLKATRSRVALVDVSNKAVLGYATVVDSFRGPLNELLLEHAWQNHIIKHEALRGIEAAMKLKRHIANKAGTRFVKDERALGTVIYLDEWR